MRVSQFTEGDKQTLRVVIEEKKGQLDAQIRTEWCNRIGKGCSQPQFSKIVNGLSRRYKVRRKTLLKDSQKEQRLAQAVSMTLYSGNCLENTLYLDEKWFSQQSPQSVRCLSPDDTARFVLFAYAGFRANCLHSGSRYRRWCLLVLLTSDRHCLCVCQQ